MWKQVTEADVVESVAYSGDSTTRPQFWDGTVSWTAPEDTRRVLMSSASCKARQVAERRFTEFFEVCEQISELKFEGAQTVKCKP